MARYKIKVDAQGVGLASSMARLKLKYGPSTSGAPVAAAPEAVLSKDKYPTELVAKFVPKHFETRLVAELFQLNELEAAFFK